MRFQIGLAPGEQIDWVNMSLNLAEPTRAIKNGIVRISDRYTNHHGLLQRSVVCGAAGIINGCEGGNFQSRMCNNSPG